MAAFKFKLETLLSHRRRLEREAMLAYRLAKAEADAIQAQIDDLEAQYAAGQTEARAQSVGAIDLQYMLAFRRHGAALRQRAAELDGHCREAQATADNIHKRLVDASRDRQLLDKLREKRLHAWRAEEARKEQADLDDLSQRMTADNG